MDFIIVITAYNWQIEILVNLLLFANFANFAKVKVTLG